MRKTWRRRDALVAHLALVARLTRWEEHVLFTVPLTLLGVAVALHRFTPAFSPWPRVLWVLAANLSAVSFAFMLNDLEDAADDALEPERAARNVVASGALLPRSAKRWTAAAGVLALGLYLPLGGEARGAGVCAVGLGFLYSWRGVRLKAWPLVDVLAHVLMLSALLFLAGYVALGGSWGEVWLTALGVALLSAYGQFYNQLRDYHTDRLARLRNTASVLGRRGTRWAMWTALAGGVACLGGALLAGWIPPALAVAVALMAPLSWRFRGRLDMRGSPAIDATGSLQSGAMFTVTVALVVWTGWALWKG